MKIKTRILLGLSSLFLIIFLLGGVGAYFIHQLSEQSKEITKDNYISLEYVRQMNNSLVSIQDVVLGEILVNDTFDIKRPNFQEKYVAAVDTFEFYLAKQQGNITENGEERLTTALNVNFQKLLTQTATFNTKEATEAHSHYLTHIAPEIKAIRLSLDSIHQVNDHALQLKSDQALHSSERVIIAMFSIGSVSFLMVVVFLWFFPSFIADPITKFTESIQAITARNFETRIRHDSKDEFGELALAFNYMAEKLDEYEHSNLAQIIFEKKRIDAIINNMNDAIIGLDADKKIIFANNSAITLIGMPAASIAGKYAPDVAAVNDLVRHLIKEIMDAKNTEETYAKPLKIVVNGKENHFAKDLLLITTPLTADKNPQFIGYVIILKNITPFHELDLAKTNFIATISHELKTPITSMMMSLKLLRDGRIGELNKEQLEMVDSVKDDSDRLLKITGELLKMSQVETGNIQLDIVAFEAAQVVDVSIHALQQQAQAKSISITHDVTVTEPVMGDNDKTTWVLINFLSNAIRYSPNDAIISVTVTESEGMVRFSVHDNGPGIDSKFQQRLFEKYYRVPGSGHTGTGLGLAISKEFINAMGGDIGVNSEIGQGSEFYFVLPLQVKEP